MCDVPRKTQWGCEVGKRSGCKQEKIKDLTNEVSQLEYDLYRFEGNEIKVFVLQNKLTKLEKENENFCKTYQEQHNEVVRLGRELDAKTEVNNELQRKLEEKLTELGESCAKSEALSALNTDLQKQLEDARNKVSDTCDTCDQVVKSKETHDKGNYTCDICNKCLGS